MPPTEVITPAVISREVKTEEEPDVAYDWARQARQQSVSRRLLGVKPVDSFHNRARRPRMKMEKKQP